MGTRYLLNPGPCDWGIGRGCGVVARPAAQGRVTASVSEWLQEEGLLEYKALIDVINSPTPGAEGASGACTVPRQGLVG